MQETIQSKQGGVRKYILPLAVLIVGISLTLYAFSYMERSERARAKEVFEEESLRDISSAVLNQVQGSLDSVSDVKSLFAASSFVSRTEFQVFVRHELAKDRGIQALEWIPYVQGAERAAYEAAAREDGLADFQFTERQSQGDMTSREEQESYFPVYYVEPLEGNQTALGFDLASSPDRLEALTRAGDSGQMTGTAPITLVQEGGKQRGFLAFVPVYRGGALPDSPEARRADLQGFALGVFRIDDLVNQALAGLSSEHIHLQVYEIDALHGDILIYDQSAEGESPDHLTVSPLTVSNVIDVAGRSWRLEFHALPSFVDQYQSSFPWFMLLTGIVVTGSVSFYLYSARKRTRMLIAQEERYRTVFEGTHDLIQSIDTDGKFNFVNPAWHNTMGYTPEELPELAFPEIVHPDSAEHCQEVFSRVMDGQRVADLEFKCRRKNGDTLILRGSAIPVIAAGKIVATTTFLRDVTERVRGDAEKKLLQYLMVQVSKAPDFGSALDITLKLVGRNTGWSLGEAWIPNSDGTALECAPAYYGDEQDEDLRAFRSSSSALTFAPGVGLPGRVWATGQPEWIQNVSQMSEETYMRAVHAKQAGFNATLGVPVILGSEVLAVLVFYMREVRREDEPLTHLISAAIAQLGVLIERRRAEDALRVSEQKYRTLVNTMGDGLVILDTDNVITFANSAVGHMLGYSSEAIGSPLSSFMDKASWAVVDRLLTEPEGNEIRSVEMGLVAGDGTRVPTLASASTLHDADGHRAGTVAVIKDITELDAYRNKLEALVDARTTELNRSVNKLSSARDRINAILQSVADGLIVTDLDNLVILANSAAADLLEFDPAEIVGREIGVGIKNDRLRDIVRDTLDQRTSGYELDIEMEDPRDGKQKIMRAVTALVDERGGEPLGTVTIIQDVTRLRELDRMKTEFLSTAAHELRTPLTSLLGFSEILLTRQLAEERRESFLTLINKQAGHLAQVIDDLLDVSRLEAGRGMEISREPIRIADVANETLLPFIEANPTHQFRVEGLREAPLIFGDPFRLAQVGKNLISNAIKYSPEGGTITIRGREAEGTLEISVRDEGMGMTPEQQEHMFEKFYRANASDTAIGGTGLGLAIAKKIVELHGGSIRVESEVGIGTVVYLNLPLTESEKSNAE